MPNSAYILAAGPLTVRPAMSGETASTGRESTAGKMTYLELSADNSFFDEFSAALFIPHTDESQFPTVLAARQASVTSQP